MLQSRIWFARQGLKGRWKPQIKERRVIAGFAVEDVCACHEGLKVHVHTHDRCTRIKINQRIGHQVTLSGHKGAEMRHHWHLLACANFISGHPFSRAKTHLKDISITFTASAVKVTRCPLASASRAVHMVTWCPSAINGELRASDLSRERDEGERRRREAGSEGYALEYESSNVSMLHNRLGGAGGSDGARSRHNDVSDDGTSDGKRNPCHARFLMFRHCGWKRRRSQAVDPRGIAVAISWVHSISRRIGGIPGLAAAAARPGSETSTDERAE